MDKLSEEIEKFKNDGEIIVCMDGNGKIGILGEEKSRNGKLIEEVVASHEMVFLNKSRECAGRVTRTNTNDVNEIAHTSTT